VDVELTMELSFAIVEQGTHRCIYLEKMYALCNGMLPTTNMKIVFRNLDFVQLKMTVEMILVVGINWMVETDLLNYQCSLPILYV